MINTKVLKAFCSIFYFNYFPYLFCENTYMHKFLTLEKLINEINSFIFCQTVNHALLNAVSLNDMTFAREMIR